MVKLSIVWWTRTRTFPHPSMYRIRIWRPWNKCTWPAHVWLDSFGASYLLHNIFGGRFCVRYFFLLHQLGVWLSCVFILYGLFVNQQYLYRQHKWWTRWKKAWKRLLVCHDIVNWKIYENETQKCQISHPVLRSSLDVTSYITWNELKFG